MSNLILAQSTTPSAAAENTLMALFAGLSLLALWVVRQRRLASIPAIPQEPGAPVLALTAGLAATCYLALSAGVGGYLGVSRDNAHSPEILRSMILFDPAVKLVTAGGILALLIPELRRALHWVRGVRVPVVSGMWGYVLALPFVFLTGLITTRIAEQVDPGASTKHVIFDLWSGEGPGVTPFKVVAVFSAVVAAPLVEELFFRGLLQRLVHRLTGLPVLAIVVASLAFMAIHSPWTTQPSIFVLSVFLGWVYFRSGSILAPIAMHALFNAIQFALFFTLFPQESVPPT